jgi:hypothetical protein
MVAHWNEYGDPLPPCRRCTCGAWVPWYEPEHFGEPPLVPDASPARLPGDATG